MARLSWIFIVAVLRLGRRFVIESEFFPQGSGDVAAKSGGRRHPAIILVLRYDFPRHVVDTACVIMYACARQTEPIALFRTKNPAKYRRENSQAEKQEAALISEGKTLRRLIVALTFIAGVAMLLLMLHVVVDVVGRVVFSSPLNGTTEIVSGYYMVAVIFFPLAYVTRYEGHIMVELFTRGLPQRQLAWLEAVVGLVCLGFLAWFAWESAVSAYNSFAQKEQWETAADTITIWPSRWILPVGLSLMGVYMALRVVDDVRIALSPNK